MTILITIYLICGVIAYGWLFGYLQENFKLIAEETYWGNAGLSLLIGLLGPIGLVGVAMAIMPRTPVVRRFTFKLF